MTRRLLLTAWFVGFVVTFPAFAGKKVEFNATVRTDIACELGYRIDHVKKDGRTDEYCAIGPKAAEPLLQKNVGQTINIKGHDGMHGQLLVLWVDKVAGESVNHRDWTGGILTGAAIGLDAAATVESAKAGQTTTTTVYSPPQPQPTDENSIPDGSNSASSGVHHFVDGLSQCSTLNLQSYPNIYVVNHCAAPLTVSFTSDSGNFWGTTDVPANQNSQISNFMGYNRQRDGEIHWFTCPQGAVPVLPDGGGMWSRTYKGPYRCDVLGSN